jgi:hypothetical protein
VRLGSRSDNGAKGRLARYVRHVGIGEESEFRHFSNCSPRVLGDNVRSEKTDIRLVRQIQNTRPGTMLHAVRWEAHSYPASGERPQAILNKLSNRGTSWGPSVTNWARQPGRHCLGRIEEIEEFRKAGKYAALYFSKADARISPRRFFRQELKAVKGQGALDPSKIKMVGPKNLDVAQFIAHAQLMVCLQFVAVAGSADAFKVFPAVWMADPQSPDEPCRYDVVHVSADSSLFEFHATGFNLAPSLQRSHSMLLPSVPRRALPRPPSLHAAPAYWPFLGTEAGPAIDTSPVAIRIVAAVNSLEHFCSSVTAIWTTHSHSAPFLGSSALETARQTDGFRFRQVGLASCSETPAPFR